MATEPERTYPSELPVLALRQTVVFPLTMQPLAINRPISIEAVNRALAGDRLLFLTLQKNDSDEPEPGDLHDDRHRRGHPADGEGAQRRRPRHRRGLAARESGRDHASRRRAARDGRRPLPERVDASVEVDAYVRRLHELIDRALSLATRAVAGAARPGRRASTIRCGSPTCSSSLIDIKAEEKQQILEADALTAKLEAVANALGREIALLEMKDKIESAAQQEMTDAQRQYYLRQQLKAIQDELGEGEKTELGDLRARLAAAKLPERGRDGRRRGSRSARAHVAGVPRIPDDPHLLRLGAGRALVDDDGGSARSGRGARRCSTRTTTISTRSRNASSSTWRCRS